MVSSQKNRGRTPIDKDYDSAVQYLKEFYHKDNLRSALEVLSEEEEVHFPLPARPRVYRTQTFRCLSSIDKVETISATETMFLQQCKDSLSVSWKVSEGSERQNLSALADETLKEAKTSFSSKKGPFGRT